MQASIETAETVETVETIKTPVKTPVKTPRSSRAITPDAPKKVRRQSVVVPYQLEERVPDLSFSRALRKKLVALREHETKLYARRRGWVALLCTCESEEFCHNCVTGDADALTKVIDDIDLQLGEVQNEIEHVEYQMDQVRQTFLFQDDDGKLSLAFAPDSGVTSRGGCGSRPDSKNWKHLPRVHRKDKKRRTKGSDKKRRTILRDALADCT
jgi:hypothetical protein